MTIERPWCCPEPRCTPLHQISGTETPLNVPSPGEMFMCFGKAPEVTFDYDGSAHKNDLRQCSYTALKGVISFQENADDWRGIANAYTKALHVLTTGRRFDGTEIAGLSGDTGGE